MVRGIKEIHDGSGAQTAFGLSSELSLVRHWPLVCVEITAQTRLPAIDRH